MAYLDDLCVVLRSPEMENESPWMYLDTKGVVTCGVGRALFTLADAQALPFSVTSAGGNMRRATAAEIAADCARVKSMRPGLWFTKYRSASSPVLDQATMDAMLYSKLHEFDCGVRAALPEFESYPDAAKMVLDEMGYNLGVRGLMRFTDMIAHVKAKAWLLAGSCCHRRDVSEARNQWAAGMFAKAAAGAGV